MAVTISANSNPLSAGLASAQRSIGAFASRAGSMLAGVGRTLRRLAMPVAMGGLLIGGLIVGELVEKFVELGKAISTSVDMATRLGMSTETLMALEHAAAQTGLSAEELHVGLMKMRRTAEGPLDEAFLKLADDVAGTEDAMKRAQMAAEFFGSRGGVKFVSMLAEGSAGIKNLIVQAKVLGFALSDADAALVESAGDAIDRVKDMMRGAWSKIVVAFAPAVIKVADLITASAPNIIGFFDRMARAITMLITLAEVHAKTLAEMFAIIVVAGNPVVNMFALMAVGAQDTEVAVVNVFKNIHKAVTLSTAGIETFAKAMSLAATNPARATSLLTSLFGRGRKAPLDAANTEINRLYDEILRGARLDRKQRELARPKVPELKPAALAYTPLAAMLEGSREALSTIARARFGAQVSPQEKKLEEVKQAIQQGNRVLERLLELGRETPDIGVI